MAKRSESMAKRPRGRLTDQDHERKPGDQALPKKHGAKTEGAPGTIQRLEKGMGWADTMRPTRIREIQCHCPWANGEHGHYSLIEDGGNFTLATSNALSPESYVVCRALTQCPSSNLCVFVGLHVQHDW